MSEQEVTVMEYLRRKHTKMCNAVSALDCNIRGSLFFSYLLNLPAIILNLYVLLLSSSTKSQTDFLGGTLILLTVSSGIQIVAVWLSAIEVHIWVSDCKGHW